MQKTRSKLNNKPSEYIEQNILKESPEGLPPCATVPEEDEIVIAQYIPEIRRVQFINGRDAGYPLEFHYHSKTHPLKHYKLFHGHEYELPVEIIEHLENCGENDYGYRKGCGGHPEMYVKGKKYFFRCQNVRKTA